MVSWLQRRDTGATLHHNTSAFVATNEWKEIVNTHHGQQFFGWNHVAGDEVFVGVAHSCHFPIHQYFVGLWFIDLNLFHNPWLIEPVKNSCT
jgi:hypothetical protein